MLSIANGEALSRALELPIDHRLRQLLTLRRDQLGGELADQAHFAIVQEGDTWLDLEQTMGFSLDKPEFPPEWVKDHGFLYEAVWILTDDGYAHVAFVPQTNEVDPQLLAYCCHYAAQHTASLTAGIGRTAPLD